MDSLEITNELQFDLDNLKKNAAITLSLRSILFLQVREIFLKYITY